MDALSRAFVPALPLLLKPYSTRRHSSIKMSPTECESSYENQTKVRALNEVRYQKVEDAHKPKPPPTNASTGTMTDVHPAVNSVGTQAASTSSNIVGQHHHTM
jgi:hypothetical protein